MLHDCHLGAARARMCCCGSLIGVTKQRGGSSINNLYQRSSPGGGGGVEVAHLGARAWHTAAAAAWLAAWTLPQRALHAMCCRGQRTSVAPQASTIPPSSSYIDIVACPAAPSPDPLLPVVSCVPALPGDVDVQVLGYWKDSWRKAILYVFPISS